MKPFLNIDEQITLCKKRGLSIDNRQIFYQFLERKNYYNSVNIYGKLFFDNPGSDRYIVGSKSSEIITIYYFEKEMRNAIFKKVIEVEANMKSTIAYYFSETYHNKEEYAYLNINNYRDEVLTNKNLYRIFTKIKGKFQRIINDEYSPYLIGTKNSVDHYIKKFGSLPLWVAIDYLTLGDLCMFFEILDAKTQDKVCKSFGRSLRKSYGKPVFITPKDVLNYLKSIKKLRNEIAHDKCLINFQLKENTTYTDILHKTRGLSANSPRQSLYDAMICIQPFISKNNYISFEKNIQKIIKRSRKGIITIDFDDVLLRYGFPVDFENVSDFDIRNI